jgi:HlyD family secretion protein
MTRRSKILIGIGVVAVAGVAAAVALGTGSGEGAQVRMEEVARRDLVSTVTASGNLRARRQVDISSEVSARVQELLVAEGDDVVEGQVLLRLDPTQIRAARQRAASSVSQARAQAAQAQANLTRAQREYERILGLWQRDTLLVSRQQVEQAEADFQVAEANLQSAEYGVEVATASLEEQEDRLDNTVFTAPMAGRVTRLNVEEGETVVVGTMNNPGSLIISIADLSVVEVVVQMDETDIPRLSLGDSAVVSIDAFPGEDFTARVTEIANSAIQDPSTSAASGQQAAIDFEVVLTLDPTPVELRPDLSATADIVTAERADALAIPIIALTVREDTTAAGGGDGEGGSEEVRDVEGVFVVEAGTVRFAPVVVGITGQEHFEVLEGLQAGDTVVAGPYQTIRTLSEGDPVRRVEGAVEGVSGGNPAAGT